MKSVQRLGDLLEVNPRATSVEGQVIAASENLANSIFGLDPIADLDAYVQHSPLVDAMIHGLPDGVMKIGAYEYHILEKLLYPQRPVLWIEGSSGSGKTTLVTYLVDQIIRRMGCAGCEHQDAGRHCHRLIARVDFGQLPTLVDRDVATRDSLMRMVTDELRARAATIISETEELSEFMGEHVELLQIKDDAERDRLERGFRNRKSSSKSNAGHGESGELAWRAFLREQRGARNPEWMLTYTLCLWNYIVRTRFEGKRECAFIILDSLDYLPAHSLAYLVGFFSRRAEPQGPIIVMIHSGESGRPPEVARGLSAEFVLHKGPSAQSVVIKRLARFCRSDLSFPISERGQVSHQEVHTHSVPVS